MNLLWDWGQVSSISHKKVMDYLIKSFSQTRLFFRPAPYPINKKKFTKNLLNYYSLKLKKFHGDSVKNESAWTKKLQEGGRRTPPPSLFRVKDFIHTHDSFCISKLNTLTLHAHKLNATPMFQNSTIQNL